MIYVAVVAALVAVALRWFAYNTRKDLRFQGGPSAHNAGLASSALLAVAALLFVFSCAVIIPAGHIGVQVLFGRVKPSALTEGIQLINPFVDVQQM
jgi:hypothetical protein